MNEGNSNFEPNFGVLSKVILGQATYHFEFQEAKNLIVHMICKSTLKWRIYGLIEASCIVANVKSKSCWKFQFKNFPRWNKFQTHVEICKILNWHTSYEFYNFPSWNWFQHGHSNSTPVVKSWIWCILILL